MTEKTQNRLLASLNYICTYEKEVTLKSKFIDVVDIIEEFDIQSNQLILYGYKNKYVICYDDVQYNVDGIRVDIIFVGTDEYKLMI